MTSFFNVKQIAVCYSKLFIIYTTHNTQFSIHGIVYICEVVTRTRQWPAPQRARMPFCYVRRLAFELMLMQGLCEVCSLCVLFLFVYGSKIKRQKQ